MDLTAFAVRYAKAWCSQDPETVAAFYAEHGSLSVNGGPPAVGRQAIANVARGFMSAFPDMKVTMDDLVRKPHEPYGTVFRWTLTGTNTGPGGTGKRVRLVDTSCGNLMNMASSRTRRGTSTLPNTNVRLCTESLTRKTGYQGRHLERGTSVSQRRHTR